MLWVIVVSEHVEVDRSGWLVWLWGCSYVG